MLEKALKQLAREFKWAEFRRNRLDIVDMDEFADAYDCYMHYYDKFYINYHFVSLLFELDYDELANELNKQCNINLDDIEFH